jgi:hypothetical protein
MRSLHALAALVALTSLALTSACELPLDPKPVPADNRCDSDEACGANGVCIEASCVATSADLTDVVIEVAVPSTAVDAPGTTQHVALPAHLLVPGPQALYKFGEDLYLARPVTVRVSLEVEDLDPDCFDVPDSEGRMPIRVELDPSRVGDDPQAPHLPLPAGIPREIYDASSDPEGDDMTVQLTVPAGFYDVYITPLIPLDEITGEPRCTVPPLLLVDEDYRSVVAGKEFEVARTLDASPSNPDEANLVRGEIFGPDVNGWAMDLIENKKGRRLSPAATLSATPEGINPTFELAYWRENDTEGVDVVARLTPPAAAAEAGMPVFFWKLDNPVKPTPYEFHIELLEAVEPIAVSGNVVDDVDYQPVPSRITVQGSGEAVLGGFGANVLYRRTVETNADGNFAGLFLLPGADASPYTVVITPLDEEHAVTTTELFLHEMHQGGTTFEVASKRSLQGTGVTARGAPAALVGTVLEPVSLAAGSFLQALRLPPVLPSSVSTFADTSGAFLLPSDVGDFNLWLRPDSASGLPWSVLTRFSVGDPETPVPDLNLLISNPIVIIGQVRVPDSSGIKDARIRAWINLTSDDATGPTPSAVQIGETISGEGGNFRLLLPASIRATLSQ